MRGRAIWCGRINIVISRIFSLKFSLSHIVSPYRRIS